MLATIAVGLVQGWSTGTIIGSSLLDLVIALASAALAMIVMPVAESATRITTDLTLLELSDLGRPLLLGRWPEAPLTNVVVLLAYGIGGFAIALALFRRRLMS